MSISVLPRPLSGIIPPLVTPLRSPDVLDRAGLHRLVEHILRGGVHGLFILGTTGEGPSLAYGLRKELITAVCTQVGSRVPVLVGITDTAFAEAIRVARFAAEAGAAGVVVAPPPYFAPSQAELLGYLKRLAAASPLPILLYNMPVQTKVFIEADTVRAAAEIPGIVGLKDSSGDMIHFHRLRRMLQDRPDFTLLVGPEELLAESVLFGGHGGVNGGANLVPEWYVQLYDAARTGDLATVRALHAQVIALSDSLYGIAGGGASLVRSLKGALALQGLCHDALAEPFVPLDIRERDRVAACLAALPFPALQPA